MENASKAILIAGGVLIGILVMSFLALFFNKLFEFNEAIRGNDLGQTEIQQFNEKLLLVEGETKSNKYTKHGKYNYGSISNPGNLLSALLYVYDVNKKNDQIVIEVEVEATITQQNGSTTTKTYTNTNLFKNGKEAGKIDELLEKLTVNNKSGENDIRYSVQIDYNKLKKDDLGRIKKIKYIVAPYELKGD